METLALDDPRALDASAVGSKAAGLARLRAGGFRVPDGLVLPVGIHEALADDRSSEELRDVAERALRCLGERIAVRSSATWEDGATSSHAGATATVLDVHCVDGVCDAIRHCIEASTAAQGSRGARGSVAVLLQRLVPAEHAGVAFTVDPLTGDADVVRIAATAGLGEALVQGEVVGADVTVRPDAVEGELDGWSASEATAVAELAREIEAFHGRPQDVEWAIADGEVHVLQARPITVLPVEPSLPSGNNWQKDVAHYPEPLTPFGWSLMHACADTITSVFDERGLLVRGLEEVFVGGEVYGRVLPAIGSADSAGSPPPAIVMGVAARLVPELRRRTATAKRSLGTDQAKRWLDDWHRTDRETMRRRAEELLEVDLAALDDDELAQHHDTCLSLVRRGQQIHFRLVMPLATALYELHRVVRDTLDWDDATIATMLAGHSPASRGSEEVMAGLRAQVKRSPGAVEALQADPRHPVEGLTRVDPKLAAQLRSWIDEHAWALVNYDAGVPVLAERPTMVTRLVLSGPAPVDLDHADEVADRARRAMPASERDRFDAALAAARAVYPVREDNTIIVGDRPLGLMRRWMLEVGERLSARGVLPAPSDAPYLLVDELRDALRGNAAEGLTEVILRRRGEEAWARAHPGPAYVGEQGAPPDISRLPAALRRVNEPVMWVISHEYPDPIEQPADEDVLLAGIAASPGTAVGPVRVIRGHHDMDRLCEGDVLVCQVTSPAWAPLFPLAAAVVADGGGALSHAAIASREHGLPAVLGTATATSELRDGQLVRVDGTRGLVLECS